MHEFALFPNLKNVPQPGRRDLAEIGFLRWREVCERAKDASIEQFAAHIAGDTRFKSIVDGIFGNSPFLTQCAVSDPEFFRDLLTSGPDNAYAMVESELTALDFRAPEGEIMMRLRRARRRVALSVALADIAGLWSLDQVTAALSAFADAALTAAARHILGKLHTAGDLAVPDPNDPLIDSGLIVLGLGKLGARELNYSSDVDLVVLYDDAVAPVAEAAHIRQTFVKVARDLVRLLADRTADGFVFRTDLRLRPDPSATPPALSVQAAEVYYESVGQNWERAAMIKARPIASDMNAAAKWMARLQPFIWRKHLDFETIQDIHSIKRQIYAHHGGADIAIEDHNIKLGRGGIREIEFFVQTQQLIWGGRDPDLRSPRTCEALDALAAAGHVDADGAADLVEAYRYLRTVEHRLQMVDDRQTHTLPADADELAEFAVFLGHESVQSFRAELVHHLRRVESLYADLFEDAPSLSIEGEVAGNLIFTGAEDDPDTLKTIAGLGFSHPASVSATIRNWHRGHRRATQTLRARQLLTELIPVILSAFGRTLDPGAAFAKFDDFLAGLPAGVQLFSMFRARPELLELLADVLGSAPRLAEHLARNPSALEGLLDVSIAAPLPPVAELKADVAHTLGHADGIQDVLDLARRWANDYKLRTGVQVLRNIVDCDQAAFDLSDIAEAALDGLIPHITNEFARVHGRIPGSEMAVVALGKLGSREMTPTSDLDLIFVYDHKGADGSDGEKPLAPTRYFARLSKRIINAVSAPTAEGKLYDIDMRLRPSGNAGPIASSFEAFAKYHEEKAWTWEHMALSRARVIAGDGALGAKISDVITKTLTAPRDAGQLRDDVIDMRTRLEREFHTESPWDTKYVRGGLVDIEFIVQYLQLKHAAARPDILSTNNHDTLKRLEAAEILAPHVAAELGDALFTWHAVQMVLRLTVDSAYRNLDAAALPESLKAVLARAARCDDFTALTSHLAGISENVLGHFNRIFELPDDGRNAAARPT